MYKIPANTLFLGKHIVFVPECHSTNTLAIQLLKKPSTAEGTVIITNNQTAGKGQRGNHWESASGQNLTFSIILKPAFLPIKDQFYLNIFVSLALRDFLVAKTDLPVSIKWPNDILVHKKKICGILIENQLMGSMLQTVVAGIGLNINQQKFKVNSATSLNIITKRQFDLAESLEELLGYVEARYLQLRENKKLSLRDEYLQHLYWRNEERIFSSGNKQFEGNISSIDEAGKLVVKTSAGLKYFDVKEIVYLR